MKNFLYLFLSVLIALPAIGYAQDVTAPPVITVQEETDHATITVQGDGVLTVRVMRYQWYFDNDTILEDVQVEGFYQYTIQRPYDDDYWYDITAQAQEDGKEPSDLALQTFVMYAYVMMPTPEITFVEDADGVTINVDSDAPESTVNVVVNGDPYDSMQFYENYSCYLPRTYEEQIITVNAESVGTGIHEISTSATADYTLGPKAPLPTIEVTESEDYYMVRAYSEAEGSTVFLFKDGAEVENPCIVGRTDDDQFIEFSAYCIAEGMGQSDWLYYILYVPASETPPTPPVDQYTSAPEFDLYSDNPNMLLVRILTSEDADVYYRIGNSNEMMQDFYFEDWREYVDILEFYPQGYYQVQAYAVAPDKLPSDTVSVSFALIEPSHTPIYDFEEDGIFYQITAEGKVSVCSETWDWNSYSGEVIIPATVTHDGATYMVTGIAANAFHACAELTSVIIGPYVTDIGVYAFQNCPSLTSVTLGDYVISVGERAFAACSALTEVKMGSGLRHIGSKAFERCAALTSVSCKAATPPEMAGSDCFDCYGTATLHVYPPVLESYQVANYWNLFTTIVAEDNVVPDAGDANSDGVFNISDVILLINKLSQAK